MRLINRINTDSGGAEVPESFESNDAPEIEISEVRRGSPSSLEIRILQISSS